MTGRRLTAVVVCIVAAVATTPNATPLRAAAAPVPGFNRDVRPILSDKCFTCHGPDAAARQADLRLDLHDDAVADRGGYHAIVPGDPKSSEVWRRIISAEPGEQMPPADSDLKLSKSERETLRAWIAAGAEYEPHWSFTPPVRPPVPDVRDAAGIRNPIDAFVRAKLAAEKLAPSPEADPETLCRRLYLDITGIPPTPEEVAEFVSQYQYKDAYAALVDKLLASPRYGERMAGPWLDAARFADTNGYQTDGPRRMWRWRDWVIDAFNQNMPFDQFTIEQLAGDLLPAPTLDQLIATGFNRNHRMNAEGGIIAEEYLVEYVADRVETTSAVWLGLTVGCARCHDHKYDPVSQRDFYRMFAFFNLVPEPGKAIRDDNSPPVILAPTLEQQRRRAELQSRVATAREAWDAVRPRVEAAEKTWSTEATRLFSLWTFDDGLLARFRFDDALADDVETATKLSFDDDAAPMFAPGPFARSLELDGRRKLSIDRVLPFDTEAPFSGSVWLRPSEATASATVYAAMDSAMSYSGIEMRLVAGRPQLVLAARVVDDAIRVEADTLLAADEWSHVAWTYDGSRSAAGVKLYVDGRPATTRIVTDLLSNKFKTTATLKVGGGGTSGDYRGRIADLRFYDRELSPDHAAIVYCDLSIRTLAQDYGTWRDPACAVKFREYFLRFAAADDLRAVRRSLQDAEAALQTYESTLPTTMVMRDVPGLRTTHILKRGEYDKPGEAVTAGVPASLGLALPTDAATDRLALARWLVNRRNPLTARVAVNRLWQQLFGVGLVKTVEDFGAQGEWPEHRELLDWLAVEYMDGPTAWDTKRLIKLIVTSATYRQASHVSPDAAARDPVNRLLARGPRFRLSGEAIRDSALAVSGLLVERLGGPSVKPYQPAGLWEELANNAAAAYEQAHGDDLYRRSLYTYRKRTVAQPMLATFDAAGRETCVVRQTRTNTPLQALNLLNDVTFVEAARALAARMMRDGGKTPAERIGYGVRLALGREPKPSELQILQRGYERRLAEFRAEPAEAAKLVRQGESPLNESLDVAELAAYTTVGNVLLNLDEFVTRE